MHEQQIISEPQQSKSKREEQGIQNSKPAGLGWQ